MATKKTKNTKNAAEYIDSAGVKLNANSDLIIEATKDGDVISARNLLNGNEYVGGAGGGITVIDIVAEGHAPVIYNATDIFNRMQNKEALLFVLSANGSNYFETPLASVVDGDTKGILLAGISLATGAPNAIVINQMRLNSATDTFVLVS